MNSPKTYRVAAIPGDGIGREVLPVGQTVVDAVAARFGFSVSWQEFDWSCDRYRTTGRMMPEDGIEQLQGFDAIYLGAVGAPDVPDTVSLWTMLMPMRRQLDLFANVRPVRLFPGVQSPLANREPGDIDFVVVRENVEGEYSEIGGRLFAGSERECAMQETVFTRQGVDRIMDYAFTLAIQRGTPHVTSATKSNGIVHTMPFWDERFEAAAQRFPEVRVDQFHIDILTAHFVQHPDWFDVIVGSNLFGDILSDLGPAVAGSIGIAPSANLHPGGYGPSLFEPVHGSAPDIAGQGIANPIAAVWSASLMLEHLGETEAAQFILAAIEYSLSHVDTRTRDLGGNASTLESQSSLVDFCNAPSSPAN